jgi:hypothetical protein
MLAPAIAPKYANAPPKSARRLPKYATRYVKPKIAGTKNTNESHKTIVNSNLKPPIWRKSAANINNGAIIEQIPAILVNVPVVFVIFIFSGKNFPV